MDRFKPALRKAARELDLPRTARAPILIEMAADLEALFEHHRRNGASEEEAARRAEQAVLGSAEMIRRLGRLHRGTWRSWSEDIGARLSSGVDLLLMAAAVAPMLIVAAAMAALTLFDQPSSAFTWGGIAFALMIIALVAAEVIRLLGHRPIRSRRLSVILVLSVLAPTFGVLAVTLGIHDTLSGLSTATSDVGSHVALAAVLAREGAGLLVGLLVGIAGALSWFILMSRSSLQIADEVDAMLQGAQPPNRTERSGGIIPLVREIST